MSKKMLTIILSLFIVICFGVPIWAGGANEGTEETERVKITMFMGNSGVIHPTGVDPSDNWAINIVEEYANVDIELEVPNYHDFQLKTQLLLASGNLPDIIHSWIYPDMLKAADQGAFLDLKPYYDKSAQMQKVCPPLNFELGKSPNTGNYWSIPMNTTDREPGWGVIVEYNLLEQYNGGKYPEDVDGYLDFFRWVKNNIPGSIPVASRVDGNMLFRNSASIFAWHGITNPVEYRIQDGIVLTSIRLPECREAVKIYRKLYEEGVLDKEFATNPPEIYFSKLREKSVASQTNYIGQIVTFVDNALKENGRIDTYAPKLKRYPASLKDETYLNGFGVFPINNNHRMVINAETEHPDLAWKVLEGFGSDELRDAQSWGREGKEYNIVDGKRVPTDRLFFNDPDNNDPDSHFWTLHMGILWGFWPNQSKYAVQEMNNPDVFKRVYDSSRWIVESGKNNGLAVKDFMPPMAEITAKQGEADAMIAQILAKTISGAISMDDYDDMVEEWIRKYGFMDDLRTEWLQAHRDELLNKGVTQVDNQQSWVR